MRALYPDQLRTFIEVVELGSFTAAARRLALSQPAVSLQVRELEAKCGVQLLDRHSKKPFPTEAGRQMIIHANRILNENAEALAAMTRIRSACGHNVRIGMTATTLSYLARDVVRRLKVEHPEIHLSIVVSASHTLADDMRHRNLDLAIVTMPLDATGLHVQVFHEDNVYAIVPEGQFDPLPAAATPKMMSGAPFLIQSLGDVQTSLADAWFRAKGCTPHSYHELHNLEACRAGVAADLGVSIIPGIMAMHPMDGVVVLPLDPPVTRKIALVEPDSRPASTAIDTVRSALLQCASPPCNPPPVRTRNGSGASTHLRT